jgi:hypothetical protein
MMTMSHRIRALARDHNSGELLAAAAARLRMMLLAALYSAPVPR